MREIQGCPKCERISTIAEWNEQLETSCDCHDGSFKGLTYIDDVNIEEVELSFYICPKCSAVIDGQDVLSTREVI